jgi:hypothetical protein
MPTQCNADTLLFAPVERRSVVASFNGGAITSDAGALLLGATDRAIGLVECFAACFQDARSPDLIEHKLPALISQRVFGTALGYEDLVDHDLGGVRAGYGAASPPQGSPSIMGLLFGSAFLGASLTVALAWFWFRDLELALLRAPTGGILVGLAAALLPKALAALGELPRTCRR